MSNYTKIPIHKRRKNIGWQTKRHIIKMFEIIEGKSKSYMAPASIHWDGTIIIPPRIEVEWVGPAGKILDLYKGEPCSVTQE
jgi:hypothetical protein